MGLAPMAALPPSRAATRYPGSETPLPANPIAAAAITSQDQLRSPRSGFRPEPRRRNFPEFGMLARWEAIFPEAVCRRRAVARIRSGSRGSRIDCGLPGRDCSFRRRIGNGAKLLGRVGTPQRDTCGRRDGRHGAGHRLHTEPVQAQLLIRSRGVYASARLAEEISDPRRLKRVGVSSPWPPATVRGRTSRGSRDLHRKERSRCGYGSDTSRPDVRRCRWARASPAVRPAGVHPVRRA